MNEISAFSISVPDTLPELARFALFGRELLAAKRAEIRAINKLSLAKGVHEQKLQEAQKIAELVTLSEMRIGAMLREIPKTQGQRNDLQTFSTHTEEVKSKSETVQELGFSKDQVSQFQRMAEHECVVHEAIKTAKQNDEIITRSAVLRKIDEAEHKPHVSFNSGNNEWYTPKKYIDIARKVMGSIDLDPASSDIAQKTVQAKTYYTAEINGLEKEWHGNVWLNPPYSAELIGQFIDKLAAERGHYQQALVLTNNATETEWFYKLVSLASAICFLKGRVKFYTPDGKTGAPLQGQALVYIGNDSGQFVNCCSHLGWISFVNSASILNPLKFDRVDS